MTADKKQTPLEQGIIGAMQALDRQLARDLQRSPAETERHGVTKWAPIETRVEKVAVIVLDAIGDQQTGVEALLVMAQAMTKALQIVIDDLGQDGLGKMRTGYSLDAMEKIERYASQASQLLRQQNLV